MKYLFIIIAILLLISYLQIRKEYVKNSKIETLIKEKQSLLTQIRILSFNKEYEYIGNGNKIDQSTIITDINNKKYRVADIIENAPKVIFFFNEFNCLKCIESELSHINKYIDKIGVDNILIFAKYSNLRDLYLFNQTNNLALQIFQIEEGLVCPTIEELNMPFVFIIDNGAQIKDIYIPEKSLHQFSTMYYNTIYEKYFN